MTDVAQLVEQRSPKPQVAGSIPAVRAMSSISLGVVVEYRNMFGVKVLFGYLGEVKKEMSLVTWPTKGQTVRLTLLVITVSIVVGLAVGLLDLVFTEGFKILIKK